MNLAEQIEICCLMEATARKPGNVHPAASFADLTYGDFTSAAVAIGKPLAASQHDGLGRAIFEAIHATQRLARTNVNLGIALLIAPLAAVPARQPLAEGIQNVLSHTTVDDAEQVYAAIRLARPGGMGTTASQDVNDLPTVTLQEAMRLAADRDRIAEQYANDFQFLLGTARPWLIDAWHQSQDPQHFLNIDGYHPLPGIAPWEAAILRLQLTLLADAPDSLVARKCGSETAAELQTRASQLIHGQWPHQPGSGSSLIQFDHWLRADGHRRNPGTTADLIAATLFAAVRDGLIKLPSRNEVLHHAERIQNTAGMNT
ncbi:MAG: triphosphoribosyl-dephospho-CoA synthase [Planctomycetes bacterium]|nr:triphosphoribosyl-dephospho-CoA synthase [Planctomycetota bacterium]